MADEGKDFWAKIWCDGSTRAVNRHIGTAKAMDRAWAVSLFRCGACGGRGAIVGFWRGEREPPPKVDEKPGSRR